MKADRILALTVATLSVLFLAAAVPAIGFDWETSSNLGYYTVSPRFFPFAAGGLCLLFSLLLALKPDEENLLGVFKLSSARRNVCLMVGIATVYVAALNTLGFRLSSILTLIAYFTGFGERRWPRILVLAVGIPVTIHYAFARFFLLELPAGRIGLPF